MTGQEKWTNHWRNWAEKASSEELTTQIERVESNYHLEDDNAKWAVAYNAIEEELIKRGEL